MLPPELESPRPCFFFVILWPASDLPHCPHSPTIHERKKHPKKICIKNFGGTLAGGQEGGLGAQILYVGVGFTSRIQCIKNFEGGV